uniref:Uncharacterized protein n=1 Tax=Glossina brevipalpis TaxID=37001 RepID=A0A1A9W047_9MUSC
MLILEVVFEFPSPILPIVSSLVYEISKSVLPNTIGIKSKINSVLTRKRFSIELIMNHRYRSVYHQTVKVNKESENAELKMRIQRSHPKPDRSEPVWERLSRVKKVPTTHLIAGRPLNNQHNLSFNYSLRFQPTRQEPDLNNPPMQTHQPLSLSPGENVKQDVLKKVRQQKPVAISQPEDETSVYLCKPTSSIKEIMTARSLSNSKSSSDEYKTEQSHVQISNCVEDEDCALSECNLFDPVSSNTKFDIESIDSNEDLKECSPPVTARSTYGPTSSARAISNFHELLQRKQCYMGNEELCVLKDVLKTDERYHNLDKNNSKLFNDILKTQLASILKNETIVKSVLNKLEPHQIVASQEVQTDCDIGPFIEWQAVNIADDKTKKVEVDVVFKNEPSLEKEIIILRTLAEKLESTFQSSKFRHSPSTDTLPLSSGSTGIVTTTSSTGDYILMTKPRLASFVYSVEHNVMVSVEVLGIAVEIGKVREFSIAKKTIVELKEDANRPFYMPSNWDNAELKRTSFKKLKENPDILIRYLRPKSGFVSFNILDQDPIFFNNILFNKTISQKNANYIDKSEAKLAICESTESYATNEHLDEVPNVNNNNMTYKIKLENKRSMQTMTSKSELPQEQPVTRVDKQTSSLFEPPIRGKLHRRRIRQVSTPMPIKMELEPKNYLFKTIIVGVMQISVFLFLIMAFTYPGPRC